MAGIASRIADPAAWPKAVRNGAGVAWVAGVLFAVVVVWQAPQRVYHSIRCSGPLEGAPSWSPDGARIVFAKAGTCHTVLFTVRPDGSGLERLEGSRGGDQLPEWSPQGDVIAFATGGSIDRIRPAGRGRRKITGNGSDFGLAWSPDARRLAFTRGVISGEDDPTQLRSDLLVMRADGTHRRLVLHHSVEPGTPAWSPDGRRLAFTGSDGLYVIGVDGKGLTRLFEEYFGPDPVSAAWSPDGRTISFVDDYGLELVDTVVPRLRRRVAIEGGSWGDGSSWAPSGRTIAFSLEGGKRPGIYLVRPDGRGLHRITPF